MQHADFDRRALRAQNGGCVDDAGRGGGADARSIAGTGGG